MGVSKQNILEEIKQRCVHGPEKINDVCFDVHYRDDPAKNVVDRSILENTTDYIWFRAGIASRLLQSSIIESFTSNYILILLVALILFILYIHYG